MSSVDKSGGTVKYAYAEDNDARQRGIKTK